jgi:hypothetical protein
VTEVNLKMTFLVPSNKNIEVLYEELANTLWEIEDKDPALFDSFMGGSLQSGELEVSISAVATNELTAKEKAQSALELVLAKCGISAINGKQETLELI